MAGKVLNAFSRGFAGTVSRSVDDIVESLLNAGAAKIEFGAPVKLSGTGVETATSEVGFVGVAVRIAKTNETYGADDAAYQPKELVDVLKRGTISVKCAAGTPALGGKVYVTAAGFAATGSNALPNAVWHSAADTNGIAELVLTNRVL